MGSFGEGCLTGKKILHLAPSSSETRILSTTPGTEIVTLDVPRGDVVDIPGMSELSNSSFDAVFCCYVICRIAPPQLSLAIGELARVLKPGGLLFSYDGHRPEDSSYGTDAYRKSVIRAFFSVEMHCATDTAANIKCCWLKGVRKDKFDTAPSIADFLPKFTVHHSQYPPVKISPPIQWNMDPYNRRAWQHHFMSLRWIKKILSPKS